MGNGFRNLKIYRAQTCSHQRKLLCSFNNLKIYRGLKRLNVQIKSATVLVTLKFTGAQTFSHMRVMLFGF